MVRPLESNDSLINELLEAITYFIRRQQLVLQVLHDLDIDVEDMGKWGAAIWSKQGIQESHLSSSTSGEAAEFNRAVQRAGARKTVAQQGTWDDSARWTYFLHGKGCRLRNTLTGEVIDWNCPNIKAFDPYFFLEHLRWRLKTEEDSLPEIREWVARNSQGIESIIQVMEQMVRSGLINPDWTLPISS